MLGLKAWWLDEPTALARDPPKDILASEGRLIIVDVNGVLLKSWSGIPDDKWEAKLWAKSIRVSHSCRVMLRPGAQDFLEVVGARANVMIWSCCRKSKLIQILKTCFPNLMKKPKLIKGNVTWSKSVIS